MDYKDQTGRIKDKLIIARKTDKNLKVFGAKSHKYLINKPLKEKQILEFEKKYKLSLPDCYKTFLTEIGNGGCSSFNSAAGPFYGIYPFGTHLDELIASPGEYLSGPVIIYPGMTDEYWSELIKRIEEYEDISDEDYDRETGKIYSGILPLGSQGCTYVHGLILNGNYKGRVVNLDLERQKPKFTYENNFLDWYERWLDEIISGELLVVRPSWFGYSMGGTDRELINKYLNSSDTDYRIACLNGLLNKSYLSPETLVVIEKECSDGNEILNNTALQILTKNDYSRAKKLLFQCYQKNPLIVFKYLFWYRKDKSEEWINEIRHILSDKHIDDELFRFATYLAEECKTDLSSYIMPFIEHDKEQIKSQARYIMGKLKK